jgi:hypothetical protein
MTGGCTLDHHDFLREGVCGNSRSMSEFTALKWSLTCFLVMIGLSGSNR